jgi:hypothetical protein
MANRLLRTIAVSIGAGLAAGFGGTKASRQPRPPAPTLNPILTRLENIESRVARVEIAPSALAEPVPDQIEALGTLVSTQSEDIASLRQELRRIENRNAEQVEAFGQKVALLEQQVPAHIDATVSARMMELEQKLRGEFQDIHHRTVDAFAETIERRVVGRIAAMETSLIEQSQSITALHEKSLQTDDNLQRLLDAVEKLCARAEAQSRISRFEADKPTPTRQDGDRHPPIAVEHPSAPEPEPELTLAAAAGSSARNGHAAVPRPFGFRPVGVAILGLAIIGFRYIR